MVEKRMEGWLSFFKEKRKKERGGIEGEKHNKPKSEKNSSQKTPPRKGRGSRGGLRNYKTVDKKGGKQPKNAVVLLYLNE